MFPAYFPYINDVNKASLQATPDKFFLPLGTNIKEAIAAMPLNPEFKKKDLSNVIAEVFNRYRTEGTSDIMDNIKDLGFEYSTVAGTTVSLADINVVPNKQKYVEEGRAQADKLDKLLKRGMLTPPEWERHFSKLWADIKDEIGDAVMKSLPGVRTRST